MSSAETLYTFRTPYPDVLERGRTQGVSMEVYRDGALVAPTEAGSSVALYGPDGTEVWSSAVTVTGSVASATIPAASLPGTLELGEGYREEWTLVIAGTTYNKRREAAVALRALHPVISDEDLKGEYPDLDRDLGSELTSWQGFIDEAWRKIIRRLRKEGVYGYLVVSASAFADVHQQLAYHLLFKWFHRHMGGGDAWRDLYEEHWRRYEAEWASLTLTVDMDHDGKADSEDRVGMAATVHVNAAPHRRLRRDSRW